MSSIFPENSNGGLLVDVNNPPSGVHNFTSVTGQFTVNGPVRFLPDCLGRITGSQINAFTSEMLNFAQSVHPTGSWDINSVQNMADALKSYLTSKDTYSLYNQIQAHLGDYPQISTKNLVENPQPFFMVDTDNGIKRAPVKVSHVSTQINSFTNEHYSFVKGLWNAPTNRALLKTEFAQSNSTLVPFTVKSLQNIFTNAAAETGVKGVMNKDGSLGSFMVSGDQNLSGTTINTKDLNDFVVRVKSFPSSGNTINISNGKYVGQLVNIMFNLSSSEKRVVVLKSTENFTGLRRGPSGDINTTPGDTMLFRQGEFVTLRWNGVRYDVVSFTPRLRSGAGWRENSDGTVTMNFNAAVPATNDANGVVFRVNLPVRVTNPSELIASVVETSESTATSGDLPNCAVCGSIFTHFRKAASATKATFGRMSLRAGSDGATKADFTIHNAKIDINQ